MIQMLSIIFAQHPRHRGDNDPTCLGAHREALQRLSCHAAATRASCACDSCSPRAATITTSGTEAAVATAAANGSGPGHHAAHHPLHQGVSQASLQVLNHHPSGLLCPKLLLLSYYK